MKASNLAEKIKNFEFSPEVYVYPTPRAYRPVSNFPLEKVHFSRQANLYIHIPFCRQICAYCGYLKIIDEKKLREKYADSLVKEIKMRSCLFSEKEIKTLHFGGGTPSLLSSGQLEKIISALLDANPNLLRTADEISIEATPESVEIKKFSRFRELGINRVSIGLQSMNDNEVSLAGRHNFSAVSRRAVKIIREAGFSNLAADLMIGIEGQNVKSFENSVREVLQLRPETVELYALGMQQKTKIISAQASLMKNKDIYTCYDIGRKYFLDAGYKQDCHNRYTIPNKGGFLQEDYIFRGMSVIGFGAGARSYADNVHFRNSFDSNCRSSVFDYIQKINKGKLPVSSAIFLDKEEKIHQYAIYNIESLDRKEFLRLFGISFEQKFGKLYQELINSGLAFEEKNKIKLTDKGLNFRDLIAKELFTEKIRKKEEKYRC